MDLIEFSRWRQGTQTWRHRSHLHREAEGVAGCQRQEHRHRVPVHGQPQADHHLAEGHCPPAGQCPRRAHHGGGRKQVHPQTGDHGERGERWRVGSSFVTGANSTITIYFINPSGKLKLSFDCTTKNIHTLRHTPPFSQFAYTNT